MQSFFLLAWTGGKFLAVWLRVGKALEGYARFLVNLKKSSPSPWWDACFLSNYNILDVPF